MGDRWWSKETVAVVTGSNKGLGHAIVIALARRGLTVVLTARDIERGFAAMDLALKAESELQEFIYFHQLDVTSEQSVDELAAWLKHEFGRIDILINNAAVQKHSDLYEDAVETLETNYFGVRRVTEKLMPLFKTSPNGARVLMISSQGGQIQIFKHNEFAIARVLEAVEHVDINILNSLVAKYLEDVKIGRIQEEKWPANHRHQYRGSKLFLNTYARILDANMSSRPSENAIYVNAMCPGPMKTDMVKEFIANNQSQNSEQYLAALQWQSMEEAAIAPVWLALLPAKDYPHGKFFLKKVEAEF